MSDSTLPKKIQVGHSWYSVDIADDSMDDEVGLCLRKLHANPGRFTLALQHGI